MYWSDYLKRYMLFGHTKFYPGGGTGDLVGQYETLDECREAIKTIENKDDFYYVYDCVSMGHVEFTYEMEG